MKIKFLFLIGKLEEAGVKTILSGCDRKNIAGIVSFKHKDAQKILDALTKGNINCAVREGMVRLSPHFYNTSDEIDRVVDELRKVI